MKFCQEHWDKMRDAIEARGMTALVASDGRSAIENTIDELQRGQTIDNFDPLMAMHWSIAGNLLERLGPAALYVMSGGPEDLIDISKLDSPELKAKYLGRTWPRCPVCYANISHEFTCRSTCCNLQRVDGWDVAIEYSADAIKAEFDRLMADRAH
jgi:hypothetical protein